MKVILTKLLDFSCAVAASLVSSMEWGHLLLNQRSIESAAGFLSTQTVARMGWELAGLGEISPTRKHAS